MHHKCLWSRHVIISNESFIGRIHHNKTIINVILVNKTIYIPELKGLISSQVEIRTHLYLLFEQIFVYYDHIS